MARPKINALPQDSVLRAHLRRQADWPGDGPRLSRRDTGNRRRRDFLDAVDRIGRINHLRNQAAVKLSAAAGLGEFADGASEPHRRPLLERIDDLMAQATALEADANRLTKTPAKTAQPRSVSPREGKR